MEGLDAFRLFFKQYSIGEKPTVILYTYIIAMQGHQKNSEDKIVHQIWQ